LPQHAAGAAFACVGAQVGHDANTVGFGVTGGSNTMSPARTPAGSTHTAAITASQILDMLRPPFSASTEPPHHAARTADSTESLIDAKQRLRAAEHTDTVTPPPFDAARAAGFTRIEPTPKSYWPASAACGIALDPAACTGFPGLKQLQPLFPDTRNSTAFSDGYTHNPIVVFAPVAAGSICQNLQSLHRPHSLVAMMPLPLDRSSNPREINATSVPPVRRRTKFKRTRNEPAAVRGSPA
jgi:hypothetical protein